MGAHAMSRVIATAELSRYAKGKLKSAKGTWFGRPVTAYLTDAYLVAGCCVGVIRRHVKADGYGRFSDGHRVRTSDVLEAQLHDGFWTIRTFTGEACMWSLPSKNQPVVSRLMCCLSTSSAAYTQPRTGFSELRRFC